MRWLATILVSMFLASSAYADWCVIPPATPCCGNISYLELREIYRIEGEQRGVELLEREQVCYTVEKPVRVWRETPFIRCYSGTVSTVCYKVKVNPNQDTSGYVFADSVLCEGDFQ